MPATRIPQHTDDLRITDETTAADVVEYLDSRLAEPAVVGDTVVWNFNSHDIDAEALVDIADDLTAPVYIVPYQVPGLWGYMVDVLPAFVSDAALLTYRQHQQAYGTYENLRGDSLADRSATQRLTQTAREAAGGVNDA